MIGIGLPSNLTAGFAAGAADGFTSRFDEDVNGWLGGAAIVATVVWAGLRATEAGIRPVAPLRAALIAGVLVAAVDCWADGFRSDVARPWLIGPADGLAIGLAVFVAASYPLSAGPLFRRVVPPALAAFSLVLNTIGYGARKDMHAGWARAAAEALCAGIVLWLLLNPVRPVGKRAGSLNWHIRLMTPAIAAVMLVTALDGQSAPWARATATGIGIGLVVAYARYRANGVAGSDAVATGVFATVIAGLAVGFGYGLLYGLVAGLAARIARSAAERSMPSVRVLPSGWDAAAGILLGGMAALAAAFNGLPALWLSVIFLASATAGAFAFGLGGETVNSAQVTTPGGLYRKDRAASAIIASVAAVAIGVAVGSRTLAAGNPMGAALLATASTIVTYGVTAGLVVSATATRFPAHALTRIRRAADGDLPWDLMTFLDDAHRTREVLRSNGAIYQFRHRLLQEAIARQNAP